MNSSSIELKQAHVELHVALKKELKQARATLKAALDDSRFKYELWTNSELVISDVRGRVYYRVDLNDVDDCIDTALSIGFMIRL